MPVTSYSKSPILRNKSCPSVTSVDFKVLPQRELVVCRGHRYHCHSECSLPQYFRPAVYNTVALSYPIRFLYGHLATPWCTIHCPDIIRKSGPMCQITYMGFGQIPQQQQQQPWHKLLTQWYICKIRTLRQQQGKLQQLIPLASMTSECVLLVFGGFFSLLIEEMLQLRICRLMSKSHHS